MPANDEEEEVPVNHVVGPWASKHKYLSDHYSLLREDGVAPLRNVVSELKAVPDVLEKDSVEQSQIYEKASMRLTFGPIHVLIIQHRFSLLVSRLPTAVSQPRLPSHCAEPARRLYGSNQNDCFKERLWLSPRRKTCSRVSVKSLLSPPGHYQEYSPIPQRLM